MSLPTSPLQNFWTVRFPYIAPLNFWPSPETDENPSIITSIIRQYPSISVNPCHIRQPQTALGCLSASSGRPMSSLSILAILAILVLLWHPGTSDRPSGPSDRPSGPRIDPRTASDRPSRPLPDHPGGPSRTLRDPSQTTLGTSGPPGPLPDHPLDPGSLRDLPWIYPITSSTSSASSPQSTSSPSSSSPSPSPSSSCSIVIAARLRR